MTAIPSPLASLVKSRKGLAALFATVVGTVFAIALTVSYFQGKFTPDAYFTHLKGAGAGVMAAWGLYLWGVSNEDAAQKSSPQSINAGQGAQVLVNSVPPPPKVPDLEHGPTAIPPEPSAAKDVLP